MNKELAKYVLFTGAGFTKNFGGFLAREMWYEIFNHPAVQKQPLLRSLLLDDFDYESICHEVLNGSYTEDEKSTIHETVFAAYQKLDEIAQNYIPATDHSRSAILYGTKKLIDHFARGRGQIGLFFTLNQDLFVERLLSDLRIVYPGINQIQGISSRFSSGPIKFLTLPTKATIDMKPAHCLDSRFLYYVKLHGSFGWESSDGTKKLVIGRNKEGQIAKEPLLAWYFGLFKQALSQNKRKLLVIGYGFADQHVNKVISDSINQQGLRLYVLSPTGLREFKEHLIKLSYGEIIYSGLRGYFPFTLLEVFPKDQSDSHAWKSILESFFTA